MKDYLKDYLAGRKEEEISRHTRGNEVPEVPKVVLDEETKSSANSSVTFGTCQGVGYPENLESQPAESPVNHPEINWRVEAMLPQIPGTGPIPFLVAREGVETQAGCCLSCGDLLNPGDAYRCAYCGRAANLAIELSLQRKLSAEQTNLPS